MIVIFAWGEVITSNARCEGLYPDQFDNVG